MEVSAIITPEPGPPPSPQGTHIIIEAWGKIAAASQTDIRRLLNAAAITSGAAVLSDHFHHFGDQQGVTGVLVLAESHISIHTWPEHNYAAIDIFMCGSCRPEKGAQLIVESEFVDQHQLRTLQRGSDWRGPTARPLTLTNDEHDHGI